MFNKVMTKAIEWKLNFNESICRLKEDDRAVTAVEYAIIAVAMSAVLLAIFKNGTLTGAITDAMDSVSSAISAENNSTGGTGGTAGGAAGS
ncbi:Flp family type IVb pilin [Vibrio vulnificus]|uniref:Flp family type IVb pilin n=1 Tax=Vibrio vulnificus TaxID=672 RepID=UPI003D9CA1B8